MADDALHDYEKLGLFYLGREFDAAAGQPGTAPVLYDAKDLTTHAVVLGMTGSGKTGLCISLLEEAAIDGIPALVVDPKGDIGNLLLAFPELRAADFAPWVDPADARRKGLEVDELAARTAETWRRGLAASDQPPERIARFRAAVDVAIYTPGSNAGLPLSVLRAFDPPPRAVLDDAGLLRDRIGAVVGGLLGLVGIAADPLASREHILLATVLEQAWRDGRALDLPGLIGAVQKPGVDRIGVFDLETFYPAKERLKLAMALNGLLASPGFGAWLQGEPLDVQRLLYAPDGRPRISIVSIAHLQDAERMYVVTLLLNELVAWMRAQPGTASLRALFYMDEIFGYFPPSAAPPSKLPMLTLLKQARAYGVGLVLATQNPVDLDYKGLGNAGTWFIGRLQTERDKRRVLDGLESALAGAELDRAALERLISSLGNRVFLMRNVHEDAPLLMQTRWALSYLRGPLALPEIERLMAGRRAGAGARPPSGAALAAAGAAALVDDAEPAPAPGAARGARPATAAPATDGAAGTDDGAGTGSARPVLPADVAELFLRPRRAPTAPPTYRASAMATLKLHYVDAKAKLDLWTEATLLAPLADDGSALWAEADATGADDAERAPLAGARFAELPASLLRAQTYAAWQRSLAAHAYESRALELWACEAPKLVSTPGESEGEFRARLAFAAREARDAEIAKLKERHGAKIASLTEQLRRAEQRVAREKSQVQTQALNTALSVGATVLGALFGRKAASVGNVGRATSAARSAARTAAERADVGRAEESAEAVGARLAAVQQELEAELAKVAAAYDPAALPLRELRVAPRKSDVAVGRVGIAWRPWVTGADGMPEPA